MGKTPIRALSEYRPRSRRLRVFAFDPSLGLQLSTAEVNELTLDVLWETGRDTGASAVLPGPIGEYLEVVDVDPASNSCYAPIDLNDRFLLAQDGLPPSEGDPQFHQQMVYAVAMTTIDHFERALGRVALWAPRQVRDDRGAFVSEEYVPRLRIYPHALREANAYYSPRKKSLLFGYFPSRGGDRSQYPGGMVFTCLSHDIVAHETTHALLDGLHPRFAEATNRDVLAFHEAFSDVVALLQRFAHASVLRHQIALTRGDLERQNMLGQLAQQFGQATGRRGALRDAIGHTDPETGEWRPSTPDPSILDDVNEPHARGAILVAAIFDAFLAIYKTRSADLFRIASNGTGVLPEGDIHPDLVSRLANEASTAATGALRMCIRALDYVAPVDITFGDYLRAIITADYDLHLEDEYNYRIAFVEAFRRWGIYPEGIRSLSVTSLRHERVEQLLANGAHGRAGGHLQPDIELMRKLQDYTKPLFEGLPARIAKRRRSDHRSRRGLSHLDHAASEPLPDAKISLNWNLRADREHIHKEMNKNASVFHRWLTKGPIRKHLESFGLTARSSAPPTVYRTWDGKTPAIEIHSVRTALRKGPRGDTTSDLVVEVCQRRRGYYDPDRQREADKRGVKHKRGEHGDFRFRRGCTFIIDSSSRQIRYAISNRGDVTDNHELERVRSFLTGESRQPSNPFRARATFGDPQTEDFALLHRR